jgi:pyruvate/2-oxoglutarate dehydrogenase complex dihydrolipoamide acyltransferase (E2) component
MPKFGLTMHEGTVQRLFKAPGEAVSAGEPLYEVETEKVLYIVEAPSAGTLAAWMQEEGATVECGGLVAVIAESGDDPAALRARYHAASANPNSAQAPWRTNHPRGCRTRGQIGLRQGRRAARAIGGDPVSANGPDARDAQDDRRPDASEPARDRPAYD